jgi:DNA-binding Xre family transcriptional regulator
MPGEAARQSGPAPKSKTVSIGTKVDREMTGKRAMAVRGSYGGMIRELQTELRQYDELKSGDLTLPNVERLDQIAPFVAKMRIAKGVSQTDLARRLGISKQVISRYEETEYQTVAMARLQEILDAIGIKALVTLSAQILRNVHCRYLDDGSVGQV